MVVVSFIICLGFHCSICSPAGITCAKPILSLLWQLLSEIVDIELPCAVQRDELLGRAFMHLKYRRRHVCHRHDACEFQHWFQMVNIDQACDRAQYDTEPFS